MVAPARGNRGSADFLRIPGPHLALSIVLVLSFGRFFLASRGVGGRAGPIFKGVDFETIFRLISDPLW